jgi:hypothetical protein
MCLTLCSGTVPEQPAADPNEATSFVGTDGKTWQEIKDPQSGTYFFCPATRESLWDRPAEATGGAAGGAPIQPVFL